MFTALKVYPSALIINYMAASLNYRAVIFDVEGTLVDCVPLVLESWRDILAKAGYSFELRQLQPYSGMDGEWMLEQLLPHADAQQRHELLKMQGEHYRSTFIHRARPFPGLRDLFHRLEQFGVGIGIATTCKLDELEIYDQHMRVVGMANAVTCGESVKHGKPDSALLRNCLEALQVSDPASALAVGDTPYDARAGAAIGVHCAGVRTGGFTDEILWEAGYEYLFDEIQQISQFWILG